MGISSPSNNVSKLYDIRQTMSQWVGWDLSLIQQDELLRLIIEFADRLIAVRVKLSQCCNGVD